VISKNIVTDYGAACGGPSVDTSAADEAAFEAFREAFQGSPNEVDLHIPSGAVCCFDSTYQQNSGWIFGGTSGTQIVTSSGIPDLKVIGDGAGATFAAGCPDSSPDSGDYFLGGHGLFPDSSSISAYVQSVSAGQSCVTLVTPSLSSIFTVGRWGLMTNGDLQGYGYPLNPIIFQYVKITSINSGTGQICFDQALTNNYSSTWPLYWGGGPTGGPGQNINEGGPAQLYAEAQDWGNTIEYDNVIFDNPNYQTYAINYSTTYNNVTWTGDDCSVPAQSYQTVFNNNTGAACGVEIDKLNSNITYNGGTWHHILFQSANSDTNVTFEGGVTIGSTIGTPQNLTCNNANLGSLSLGAVAYGVSQTFSGANCVIASLTPGGFHENTNNFTVSSGTLSIASTSGPVTWAIPGSKPFFSGSLDYEGVPFTITSLSTDGNSTLIGTTLTGNAFPTLPKEGGTDLFIQTDPMPLWSCSHCTGTSSTVDLSQAGAQNAPIYTYSNRIYTCTNNVATIEAVNPGVPVIDINSPPDEPEIWGTLATVTVDVLTPDTSGNGTVAFHLGGRFDNYATLNSSGAEVNFGPIINLKTAGTRTITQSSVTGAQTGDTLGSAPGAVTMTSAMPPYLGTNISGDAAGTCPVVAVTLQTSR